MKSIFKLSFVFIVLTNICCNSSTKNRGNAIDSEANQDDYSAKIDSLIQTTSPRKFNGVILITKNGETKYSKAYGHSDIENQIPISLNDKYRIMSNSKQITAVLLLKQVEKGQIDLQRPIITYLPDLNQSWANKVTVHQLLNMSSGIATLEEPLLFQPGKGYHYSNPAYGLLGRIIESVTGKPYSQMANALFKELGMNNSYCYQLGQKDDLPIKAYWLENETYHPVEFDSIGFTEASWKNFLPAGGIISTAQDLNLWDTQLHGGEVLSPSLYNAMITPSNRGPHAAFDNDTIGYAYGLRVHDTHRTPHLGHGGRGFGFASIKFYIPEKDVVVIVWENIYSRDPDFLSGNIVYYFENEIRKIIVNSSLVE